MARSEELSGVQKAAVLLIALGPDKSANVFKHLKEDEIEQLTLEISNTRSVSPAMKDQVLDEFYDVCLAQQYIAEGGVAYAKDLLEKAFERQMPANYLTLFRMSIHRQLHSFYPICLPDRHLQLFLHCRRISRRM